MRRIGAVLLLLLALIGCAAPADPSMTPTLTASAVQTHTPLPSLTWTPLPTSTSPPTFTPRPTSTVTPTPVDTSTPAPLIPTAPPHLTPGVVIEVEGTIGQVENGGFTLYVGDVSDQTPPRVQLAATTLIQYEDSTPAAPQVLSAGLFATISGVVQDGYGESLVAQTITLHAIPPERPLVETYIDPAGFILLHPQGWRITTSDLGAAMLLTMSERITILSSYERTLGGLGAPRGQLDLHLLVRRLPAAMVDQWVAQHAASPVIGGSYSAPSSETLPGGIEIVRLRSADAALPLEYITFTPPGYGVVILGDGNLKLFEMVLQSLALVP